MCPYFEIYLYLHVIGYVKGGWEGSLETIAEKYEKGGYPEMASFIKAVKQ